MSRTNSGDRVALGVARDGGEPAALERGLGGGVRASVGTGRGLRGPGQVPGHHVPGGELELRGTHARLLAQQRAIHRPARAAQGHVRLSLETRRARTPGVGAGLCVVGGATARGGAPVGGRAAVAARGVGAHPRPPARPGPQVPALDLAGPLGTRTFVRVQGGRRDVALCVPSRPARVACRRCLEGQGRCAPCTVAGHAASGDDGDRPRRAARRTEPLGRRARSHHRAGRRRQAPARRQPPRRALLRDRDSGHPRGRHAGGQSCVSQPRQRDCGRDGPA